MTTGYLQFAIEHSTELKKNSKRVKPKATIKKQQTGSAARRLFKNSRSLLQRGAVFAYKNRSSLKIIAGAAFFVTIGSKPTFAQDLPVNLTDTESIVMALKQMNQMHRAKKLFYFEILSTMETQKVLQKPLVTKQFCLKIFGNKFGRRLGHRVCHTLFKLRILVVSKDHVVIITPYFKYALFAVLLTLEAYLVFLSRPPGYFTRPIFTYKMIGHQVYKVIPILDDPYWSAK